MHKWHFLFSRSDGQIEDQYGRILLRIEWKPRKDKKSVEDVENDIYEKCFEINNYQYNGIFVSFAIVMIEEIAFLYLINHGTKCNIPSNILFLKHIIPF